jgi:hypothetical protein
VAVRVEIDVDVGKIPTCANVLYSGRNNGAYGSTSMLMSFVFDSEETNKNETTSAKHCSILYNKYNLSLDHSYNSHNK